MHSANPIVVDENREQVAQFPLQSELRIQLVENCNLLVAGTAGFSNSSRNSRLPSHVPRKSPSFRSSAILSSLDGRQRRRKHGHIGKRMRRPLLLPSLACAVRRVSRNEFGDQRAVGLRCENQLLCSLLDGEVGGEVTQRTFRLGRSNANSCSADSTMRALSSSREALTRFSSSQNFLLNFVPAILISSSRPDSWLRPRCRRALASSVALRAVCRLWPNFSSACGKSWEVQRTERDEN